MRIALLLGITIMLFASACSFRHARYPNIVLICIDGCRADHLSAYGYARETSPNVDQLAREGVTFLHNYAQANESLYSHASLFSSRYPTEIGPLDFTHFRITAGLETLPVILKQIGYRTGGFTGGGYVIHDFGFNKGFDSFNDLMGFEGFAISEPKAIRWIRDNRQSPMFVFLHGYDCHRPYYVPTIFRHGFDAEYNGDADRYLADITTLDHIYNSVYYPDFQFVHEWSAAGQRLIEPHAYDKLSAAIQREGLRGTPLSKRDIEHIIAHYDSAVLYADTWLGVFFAQLRELGLNASNTLVVVLADHGEDLMEHGFFNHRIGLQTANLHVPLIFWGAGVTTHGARYDGVTENVDAMTTILSLIGQRPPVSARGKDLSPLLNGTVNVPSGSDRLAFAQGLLGLSTVIGRDDQLICEGAPCGSARMRNLLRGTALDARHYQYFDLRNDPTEQRNLISSTLLHDRAERLRETLLNLETQVATSPTRATPLSPELERSLREHGY